MESYLVDAVNLLTQLVSCSEEECPASSFTAMGAAFATQGYYLQSTILSLLGITSFGNWMILVYICAVVGGMLTMVLGGQPRHYVWFFVGPALLNFLLNTTEEVVGVAWQVEPGSQPDQKVVWRLAEAGLRNSTLTDDLGLTVSSNDKPQGGDYDGKVPVAYFFVWWDWLLSGTVQHLVQWTGFYRQRPGNDPEGDTNLAFTDVAPRSAADWEVLSPLKWAQLENITAARLHTPDLRDAFVMFLSSECGDALSESVDKETFLAAGRRGSAQNLPQTVFRDGYKALTYKLATTSVPMPRPLKNMLSNRDTDPTGNPLGSFASFDTRVLNPGVSNLIGRVESLDSVTCALYLYILMQGFRWEAGHLYHQMMTTQDATRWSDPDATVYSLFYGWDIRDASGTQLTVTSERNALDLHDFARYLTMIYLFRNELESAPDIGESKWTTQKQETENYVSAYQRGIGPHSKYGELFSWMQLIPYIQGLLFYILAAGYPFACVMILMPQWNKMLFTWMSFWAWAKLWDVGFAVVMTLERSLWAMFANHGDAAAMNARIVGMHPFSEIQHGIVDYHLVSIAPQPIIEDIATEQGWIGAVKFLDQALILSSNVNYDITNGFYMYIMAALYMAVPTVTGTLVLGARAGSAGLVGSMIGDPSKQAGGMAQSGRQGVLTNQLQAGRMVMNQEVGAKAMRKGGFAAEALGMQNSAMEEGIGQAAAGTMGTNRGYAARTRDLAAGSQQTRNTIVGNAIASFTPSQGGSGGSSGGSAGSAAQGTGSGAAGSFGAAAPAGAGGSAGALTLGSGKIAGLLKGTGSRAPLIASGINLGVQNSNIGDQAGFMAEQAMLGVQGFGHGQRQAGFQTHGHRAGNAAKYSADMAVYEASRNHSMSKAGGATVAGVFLGAFGPTQKPGADNIDGFAASGQGGARAQAAYSYTNPRNGSGFFGQLGATQDRINRSHGAGSIYQQANTAGFDFGGLQLAGVQLPGCLNNITDRSGGQLQQAHHSGGKYAYGHMGSTRPKTP